MEAGARLIFAISPAFRFIAAFAYATLFATLFQDACLRRYFVISIFAAPDYAYQYSSYDWFR